MRKLLRKTERKIYFFNRTLGDVNAALRGPVPLAKRLIRRKITRGIFRALR